MKTAGGLDLGVPEQSSVAFCEGVFLRWHCLGEMSASERRTQGWSTFQKCYGEGHHLGGAGRGCKGPVFIERWGIRRVWNFGEMKLTGKVKSKRRIAEKRILAVRRRWSEFHGENGKTWSCRNSSWGETDAEVHPLHHPQWRSYKIWERNKNSVSLTRPLSCPGWWWLCKGKCLFVWKRMGFIFQWRCLVWWKCTRHCLQKITIN